MYGFDICKPLVYDIHHTICHTVVKNQAERLLDLEMIDKGFLDKEIKKFSWPKELKNGRIPRFTGNVKGMGQWKAEGLQKFSFPILDCILVGQLTNPKELEIQSLVSRLTEIHFHTIHFHTIHFHTGRSGWTDNLIDQHCKLSWHLNILAEEVQGLVMCTISLHNLTHIHEDVIAMSSTDNYWCVVFERAVREYVKRLSEGIEATFATAEAQREFLKPLKEINDQVGKINNETVFISSSYIQNVKISSFLSFIYQA